MNVIVIVLCVLSGMLVICSVWLTIWARGIPRRALRKTAREHGISEAYLSAVLANNNDVCAGRITQQEWKRQAVKIAYQFPHDSGWTNAL